MENYAESMEKNRNDMIGKFKDSFKDEPENTNNKDKGVFQK